MLEFYTAHISYGGSDKIDITVKGQDKIGHIFAPTWDMVMDYKNGKIEWIHYEWQFHKRMFQSYYKNRTQWDSMLTYDKGPLTFTCYCPVHTRCHRSLVAEILQWMGAKYLGEKQLR